MRAVTSGQVILTLEKVPMVWFWTSYTVQSSDGKGQDESQYDGMKSLSARETSGWVIQITYSGRNTDLLGLEE